MDLTAVINSAARQHHSHALPHVCGVVTEPDRLQSPGSQQAASAELQQGEHGGQSARRTTSSSSASAAL